LEPLGNGRNFVTFSTTFSRVISVTPEVLISSAFL
jgi:hypothetical protein